jgi:hypothetical protein
MSNPHQSQMLFKLLQIDCFFWGLGCAFLAIVGLVACNGDRSSKGNLVIRNDILDKKFNSFVIDKVVTTRGRKSFRRTIDPTEEIALPYKSVVSFRLTREYEDIDRIYHVKCPANIERRTVIKLIDVHTNRIRGGCRLVKKGERQPGGFIRWR